MGKLVEGRYALYAVLVIALITVLFEFVFGGQFSLDDRLDNRLALGDSAEADEVNVPIELYDIRPGVKKAELIALREEQTAKFPQLLPTAYKPLAKVFDGIDDSLPWWSARDYYAPDGQEHLEGFAAESLGLANPFMLVSADFRESLSNGSLAWDRSNPDAHLFQPPPSRLVYHPKRSQVELEYNLSPYFSKDASVRFASVAYNALDFNYLVISFKQDSSLNVSNDWSLANLTYNLSILHSQTGRCGYKNGCNARSPLGPLAYLKITSLPARAVFHLWTSIPKTETSPPELEYTITFN